MSQQAVTSSRGIFLQTMTVCPVLESIRVVTGTQRQDTVLAFSRLVTTQCSMTSAVGGGIRLRTGAGGRRWCGGATGFFLAEQPTSEQKQDEPQVLHGTNRSPTRPL